MSDVNRASEVSEVSNVSDVGGMSGTFRAMMPAVYHPLLPAFFDSAAIREEKATCDDCAMCAKGTSPPVSGVVYFRPDTKCCTYHPYLPNFLVGAALADPDPALEEGRRRLRARIQSRVSVTPLWLAPPRKQSVLFTAARRSSFGRSLMLRCPYFEPNGGLCTIWKHRESVCSTFFCKHTGGNDAKHMWNGMQSYLRHAERYLGRYAMASIAPRATQPDLGMGEISLEDLEGNPPHPDFYRTIWQDWEGREEEFYIETYKLVSALSRDDFERIVNVDDGPRLLTELSGLYDSLRFPVLAERLMLNPDRSETPTEGGVLMTTYSRYETVLVNEQLHEVLKELTGKETVAEVRARLARDYEVDLPESMLIALQQLRIVIPPPAAAEAQKAQATG